MDSDQKVPYCGATLEVTSEVERSLSLEGKGWIWEECLSLPGLANCRAGCV